MDSIQIAVLAIIQGITELLPVSSTAHMLLGSEFLFHKNPDLLLLTILQFGTTVAILAAYWDFLIKDFFSKEKLTLYAKVVIATLPAVIFALITEEYIQSKFYTPLVIAISLFVWGIAMILVEKYKVKYTTTELTKVTFFQAFMVGIAQAIAIIPGTSRSGSTTVVGILTGIEKYVAIQFSFLLGLPILIGSFAYEVYKYRDRIEFVFNPTNIFGMILAGIVGYISILVLKRFSKSRFLTIFGIYRIVLAVILFLTLVL